MKKEYYWEVTDYKCSLCGATQKVHQHMWKEIWHDAEIEEAWTEEVYGPTEYHVFCSKCGEQLDVSGHEDDENYYNYHSRKCQASYVISPVYNVTYVDHPEKVIKEGYYTYECTTCGATK